MKILVTGGSGFVGSRLVARLREHGHSPFVARSVFCDLTDYRKTLETFRLAKPELVFHLAADVGGIGANQKNPGRFWYRNLVMGAHVLEASRVYGVKKFITVGTVCSYPKFPERIPFMEDDFWGGYPEETNAPYGVAKKALLVGCQAYRDQYGMKSAYLVPTNLYGPGDNFDLETSHVIPAMIRKMIENPDEVVLWGDGSPTRDFLYVEDCVDALMFAIDKCDDPEPVNIGSGLEVSMKDLAEMIGEALGYKGKIVWDTSKPNGQPRRVLNNTRAMGRLGFMARTALRHGLRNTVAWYRSEES